MKKQIQSLLSDWSTWLNLCTIYTSVALAQLIGASWNLMGALAIIAGIVFVITLNRELSKVKNMLLFEKQVKKTIKKAKKTGDTTAINNVLDDIVIPKLREEIPTKIYKYYSLGKETEKDRAKIESVNNNQIWSSVYSAFNDPFECQYMYLLEEDFVELGFKAETKLIWDKMMEELRQHITTVCFTQNPNDMPMWAHYANEHKGFCMEYEIENKAHLYPVIYTEERLKAPALFIDVFYKFFCGSESQKRVSILKQIMFLSAFKDKSWESEHETRAIFLNTKSRISKDGRLCTCAEIGIHPTKIYIGAKCSQENTEALSTLAQDLQICCEICEIYKNCGAFRVTKEEVPNV